MLGNFLSRFIRVYFLLLLSLYNAYAIDLNEMEWAPLSELSKVEQVTWDALLAEDGLSTKDAEFFLDRRLVELKTKFKGMSWFLFPIQKTNPRSFGNFRLPLEYRKEIEARVRQGAIDLDTIHSRFISSELSDPSESNGLIKKFQGFLLQTASLQNAVGKGERPLTEPEREIWVRQGLESLLGPTQHQPQELVEMYKKRLLAKSEFETRQGVKISPRASLTERKDAVLKEVEKLLPEYAAATARAQVELFSANPELLDEFLRSHSSDLLTAYYSSLGYHKTTLKKFKDFSFGSVKAKQIFYAFDSSSVQGPQVVIEMSDGTILRDNRDILSLLTATTKVQASSLAKMDLLKSLTPSAESAATTKWVVAQETVQALEELRLQINSAKDQAQFNEALRNFHVARSHQLLKDTLIDRRDSGYIWLNHETGIAQDGKKHEVGLRVERVRKALVAEALNVDPEHWNKAKKAVSKGARRDGVILRNEWEKTKTLFANLPRYARNLALVGAVCAGIVKCTSAMVGSGVDEEAHRSLLERSKSNDDINPRETKPHNKEPPEKTIFTLNGDQDAYSQFILSTHSNATASYVKAPEFPNNVSAPRIISLRSQGSIVAHRRLAIPTPSAPYSTEEASVELGGIKIEDARSGNLLVEGKDYSVVRSDNPAAYHLFFGGEFPEAVTMDAAFIVTSVLSNPMMSPNRLSLQGPGRVEIDKLKVEAKALHIKLSLLRREAEKAYEHRGGGSNQEANMALEKEIKRLESKRRDIANVWDEILLYEAKVLRKSEMVPILDQLSEAGFKQLSAKLKKLFDSSDTVDIKYFTEVFSLNSVYAKHPEDKSIKVEGISANNIFKDFVPFLLDETLCAQCDGGNSLMTLMLGEYYKDYPEIDVELIHSYMNDGNNRLEAKELHATLGVYVTKANRRRVLVNHLDATPAIEDTRPPRGNIFKRFLSFLDEQMKKHQEQRRQEESPLKGPSQLPPRNRFHVLQIPSSTGSSGDEKDEYEKLFKLQKVWAEKNLDEIQKERRVVEFALGKSPLKKRLEPGNYSHEPHHALLIKLFDLSSVLDSTKSLAEVAKNKEGRPISVDEYLKNSEKELKELEEKLYLEVDKLSDRRLSDGRIVRGLPASQTRWANYPYAEALPLLEKLYIETQSKITQVYDQIPSELRHASPEVLAKLASHAAEAKITKPQQDRSLATCRDALK